MKPSADKRYNVPLNWFDEATLQEILERTPICCQRLSAARIAHGLGAGSEHWVEKLLRFNEMNRTVCRSSDENVPFRIREGPPILVGQAGFKVARVALNEPKFFGFNQPTELLCDNSKLNGTGTGKKPPRLP